MEKIISLALVLAVFSNLHAQTNIYLAAGAGVSTFSAEMKDLTPVPSIGIAAKAYEKNGLSFCPALLYQQRAQTTKSPGDFKATVRMHTLNIEGAIQYRTEPGVAFLLGYSHAINLYSSVSFRSGGDTYREKATISDDLGLMLGLAYDADQWALRATYKNGLVSVYDGAHSRSFFLQFMWRVW